MPYLIPGILREAPKWLFDSEGPLKIRPGYFLKALPWAKVPRVVVLDNAGLHTKAARLARRALIRLGIYLYFLPAYSPELNEIEPVFRQVKYQEMPVRSYTSKVALREAVEHAFSSYAAKLGQKKSGQQLRPAA